MSNDVDYLELVRLAQLGRRESMRNLAQLVEENVRAYIYRLTLNVDLTKDLSQETLLEMIKSLKNLEFDHPKQFWGWLYRTALGKVQLHFRYERRKTKLQTSILDDEHILQRISTDYNNGLDIMIRKELSRAILKAMAKLKLRHRSVLILRCLEQKPYSEIADIMACSEMTAQVLFFRAKRSLKRQLSKDGFGKGLLLAALGLFARITAPAKAAPSSITITSIKVGIVPAIIGTAATKIGLTTTAAIIAIVFIVGTITATHNHPPNTSPQPTNTINSSGYSANSAFKYPHQLLNVHDPDGDGFKGLKDDETIAVPIPLEKWLIGPPPSETTSIILPPGHWIELNFPGKIVDGPGSDIIITEWGAKAEQVRIFITDGAGNERLLGIATIPDFNRQVPTKIGFDIAGISLPFTPSAVRILGVKGGGGTPGFDLHSVQARIFTGPHDL